MNSLPTKLALLTSQNYQKLCEIPLKIHLQIGFIIRILLVMYSHFHDLYAPFPYTDIDYTVFTDASRHMFNLTSPYNRQTYRYSPLLSFILLPNIFLFHSFGKIIFSLVDLGLSYVIYAIVKDNFKNTRFCLEEFLQELNLGLKRNSDSFQSGLKVTCHHCSNSSQFYILTKADDKIIAKQVKQSDSELAKISEKYIEIFNFICDNCIEKKSIAAHFLWVYNPIAVVIATRGNADSISSLLVVLTLYLFKCRKKYFLAGVIFGLAIHLRIYPILFSLSLFLNLSTNSSPDFRQKDIVPSRNGSKTRLSPLILLLYLIPNEKQLMLVFGCCLCLSTLTTGFYLLYGYPFLYESYIYHLVRKDTRHNFSIFFYLSYLTADIKNIGIWQKLLTKLPNIVLQMVVSAKFGLQKDHIYFTLFIQAFLMVTYNTVVTSQYFLWYLSLLPLVFWQINFEVKDWFKWAFIWFVAQLAWLLPAYMLEFQGINTFLMIWLQSVAFFSANVLIISRVIKGFSPYPKMKIKISEDGQKKFN